ncbi:hypothetical protein QQF64_026023 [Cirrhinus molitorella]|uniref:Integrase catalytic domain-containing protein n=1 Tax=Cirrhinus molitorella TaxID=172907 RepID=A0ABR3NR38_9TELE
MQSSGPMDLVCIDFLSLEADSRNVCNVLVVTDHYTRYAQAFPTRDQKASTVAKTLWEKYFIHYGLPAQIHSDQGRDFESQLVSDMLTMLGVKKSRTSPYPPTRTAREETLTVCGVVETAQTLIQVPYHPQVGIEQEAGPWRVHFVGSLLADDPTADTDTFQIKLLALLQQEGKSMDEVKAIVMGDQSPKSDISVDLVNAIGKLVDRCNQSSTDGPSYRKLRLFSGLKPVPPGEEEYEIWMEQAAQMTSEWQCT